MPDIVSPEVRSRMMSGIGSKDTAPEMTVRRYLHSRGLRYRLHVNELPGRPDIVLPRHHTVVLVHGCFWHRHPGCRFAYHPKSRQDFWEPKLTANSVRDEVNQGRLVEQGWHVEIVWECEADDRRLDALIRDIRRNGSVAAFRRRRSNRRMDHL